ncbi:hypothetical protein SAMN04490220_8771 [Rhodococcus jostii]|uniref:Uncharacterized protein n=2 Tax=Rhodococcus jostii TaxID=132919 RepID=A0A1H5MAR9_RHOJO|nr:hypothetical protein SAMN04490220_8771 [Rhodococcus jostii]
MRSLRWSVCKALLVAGLVATPLVWSSGEAVAAPGVTPFQIPRVWASGTFGLCFPACVDAPFAVTGEAPGVVTFHDPTLMESIVLWVGWTNLSTGASGVVRVTGDAPGIGFTGAGVVVASAMGNLVEYVGARGIFYVQ